MEETTLTQRLEELLRRARKTAAVLAIALGPIGPALPQEPPADASVTDPDIVRFAIDMEQQHGFDAEALASQLAAIPPNDVVLQAIMPAATAERKSWFRYRARFLTPQRIRGGVKFWQAHRPVLARAEETYGVPAAIIVAIIGVETEYGRDTGRFSALQALTTLAFYYPPRSAFFREELGQLLVYARENKLPVEDIRSSYAGALGIPQFMPGSLRRYAVDFDQDGKIDLAGSDADAIGSVAAFLAAHGWVPGAPVAVPAAIEGEPPQALVDAGIRPSFNRAQIEAMGLAVTALPADRPVALIDLVSPDQATEYWWGFDNFFTITRYNRSSSYAMAVYHLSEAIAEARQRVASGGAAKAKAKAAASAKAGSRGSRRRGG